MVTSGPCSLTSPNDAWTGDMGKQIPARRLCTSCPTYGDDKCYTLLRLSSLMESKCYTRMTAGDLGVDKCYTRIAFVDNIVSTNAIRFSLP